MVVGLVRRIWVCVWGKEDVRVVIKLFWVRVELGGEWDGGGGYCFVYWVLV